MHSDPIADFLTRIRNGQMAGHKVVEIPASNIKKEITKILFDKGYILSAAGGGRTPAPSRSPSSTTRRRAVPPSPRCSG